MDNKCVKDTQKYIKELKIKTPTHNQLVKNLSGGNQQKVIELVALGVLYLFFGIFGSNFLTSSTLIIIIELI
ncbi:hypothetical protein I6U48_07600 [Clostridium sp. PL3]|uniref:Uncharacterized protein n=1 Tax=Clostridium thailandense TaxID=2794346 RepID=A0A949WQH8_9CLOT|nr:hypothetical protein [Clostridium thailandense]MBV7272781.1 hypothetical protein [Clostridium thailandense]